MEHDEEDEAFLRKSGASESEIYNEYLYVPDVVLLLIDIMKKFEPSDYPKAISLLRGMSGHVLPEYLAHSRELKNTKPKVKRMPFSLTFELILQ